MSATTSAREASTRSGWRISADEPEDTAPAPGPGVSACSHPRVLSSPVDASPDRNRSHPHAHARPSSSARPWPKAPGDFPPLENAAIPGRPPRLQPPVLVMGSSAPLMGGQHGLAAPATYDWDGDGKKDLLIGEFETGPCWVRVHLNVGENDAPRFTDEFEYATDNRGGQARHRQLVMHRLPSAVRGPRRGRAARPLHGAVPPRARHAVPRRAARVLARGGARPVGARRLEPQQHLERRRARVRLLELHLAHAG